eukprot:TRINITY_DN73931_c0_g1_i1.p1 TRINITY_DN73931_c0_g1~~TRINITY_DN73931_c0_g1_i1.p1  ORF type:complete len:225 (-),score=48.97 TRINITY_DN73931_c0_g1_i1:73-714(-)
MAAAAAVAEAPLGEVANVSDDQSVVSYDQSGQLAAFTNGLAVDEATVAMLAQEFGMDEPSVHAMLAMMQSAEGTYANQAPVSTREHYPDNCAVHVSNLNNETTPEDLFEHFSACGDIRRIIIKVDKYTGERQGFGFIDFAAEANVADALVMDGSTLKDNDIKVSKKRPPDQSRKGKGKGWGYWGYWGQYNNWGYGGGWKGNSWKSGGKGWGPY